MRLLPSMGVVCSRPLDVRWEKGRVSLASTIPTLTGHVHKAWDAKAFVIVRAGGELLVAVLEVACRACVLRRDDLGMVASKRSNRKYPGPNPRSSLLDSLCHM